MVVATGQQCLLHLHPWGPLVWGLVSILPGVRRDQVATTLGKAVGPAHPRSPGSSLGTAKCPPGPQDEGAPTPCPSPWESLLLPRVLGGVHPLPHLPPVSGPALADVKSLLNPAFNFVLREIVGGFVDKVEPISQGFGCFHRDSPPRLSRPGLRGHSALTHSPGEGAGANLGSVGSA